MPLVIGNNQYQELPDLVTAVNDSRDVGRVLEERYGFEVSYLDNATRDDLFDALAHLEDTLTVRDNLLVYYAGHGTTLHKKEYWLPTDASLDETSLWVSTADEVTARLDELPVRHLLVVADSCYSGAQGKLPVSSSPVEELLRRESRLVMTSGDLAPVIDDSGSGHSIFAQAFIDTLRVNDRQLQAAELFEVLAQIVPEQAMRANVEQDPTFAPIPNSIDGGGMFYFVPSAAAASSF